MSEQDFFALLDQLREAGVVDQVQQAQELLENIKSGGETRDMGEILTVIQGLTSDLNEQKRRELKEFIAQAVEQLDSEQFTADLLKMLDLFL